jgi:hypothetical protein
MFVKGPVIDRAFFVLLFRHTRVGGYPLKSGEGIENVWIPVFTGMTLLQILSYPQTLHNVMPLPAGVSGNMM